MESRCPPHHSTAVQALFHGRPLAPVKARGNGGAFRVGIEEEYFLCDAETRRPAAATPDALFRISGLATDGQVKREFLQNQVEVATPPFESFTQARSEILYVRGVLGAFARDHGLMIMACGTHPTAVWGESVQSVDEHYDTVMEDLQMIGRRNMLCGMHVHVEFPDPERRVHVMNRMLPYIPLLLALSTSSPFWQSRCTGLKGYRLAAYDELPRTGIPELFRTVDEYELYVASLVRSGVMSDASHIWWTIRPSLKYPTLELRAPDSCTRVDDAIAIAALYRVLIRHLYFNPGRDRPMDAVSRALVVENKWRAQRYGVQATFATRAGAVPVGSFLDEVIELTREDAQELDCAQELEHCRTVVAQGTSADRQTEIFNAHAEQGLEAALAAVVDWIAEETVRSA